MEKWSNLINQFVASNTTIKEFNKANNICRNQLRKWAIKLDMLEEYNKGIKNGYMKILNSRKGRGKFNPVDDQTKSKAMQEFIDTNMTTKDIAKKYGFNERRLRTWFKNHGKLDIYEHKIKKNISSMARLAMPLQSKVKISNKYNIFYKDGNKIEVKNNCVKGIRNRQENKYIHRIIMERILGRELKKSEVVHHINLNPTDNRKENLMLLQNDKEHGKLHQYLQHALVQLLSEDDLNKLTNELVKIIRKEA